MCQTDTAVRRRQWVLPAAAVKWKPGNSPETSALSVCRRTKAIESYSQYTAAYWLTYPGHMRLSSKIELALSQHVLYSVGTRNDPPLNFGSPETAQKHHATCRKHRADHWHIAIWPSSTTVHDKHMTPPSGPPMQLVIIRTPSQKGNTVYPVDTTLLQQTIN